MAGYHVLICLLSYLFLSPMPEKDGLMLVGQFNIYMDGEREEIFIGSVIDRQIYLNDCEALIDLYHKRFDVCSEGEMNEIQKYYLPQTDTLKQNNNKL